MNEGSGVTSGLSAGWRTHLAVVEHSGAVIEPGDGHLVVRTPQSPAFHWGNFVLVTDPEAGSDADRWVGTFARAFPQAGWVAVGLVGMPDSLEPWSRLGISVELDDVLSTTVVPREAPLAPGYHVRRLAGDDWERQVVRDIEENGRTGEYDPDEHEAFVRRQAEARRALSDRDLAAFFGAFAGDELVADLGVVLCGSTARFQNVGTAEDHRCRGLASHLLGVASAWARDEGCNEWVIVTESTNAAGRVYRRAGFEPDVGIAQAYRRPPLA